MVTVWTGEWPESTVRRESHIVVEDTAALSEVARRWEPTTDSCGMDPEESIRVARLVRAVKKQCFFNARKVILKLDEYSSASYSEGFAVLAEGIAIEHAWIVRAGLVVDPTLPDGVRAYYPGLEFVGRPGIEGFLATPAGRGCKRSPFFHSFGWGGHESESFRRARLLSENHMRALCGV